MENDNVTLYDDYEAWAEYCKRYQGTEGEGRDLLENQTTDACQAETKARMVPPQKGDN